MKDAASGETDGRSRDLDGPSSIWSLFIRGANLTQEREEIDFNSEELEALVSWGHFILMWR